VLGVEAEAQVVVRPEKEHRKSSDPEQQTESDPVPGPEAVRHRLASEQRARERRRKDQRRSSRLQALNSTLLLQQPAEGFLVNEGCASIVLRGCTESVLRHAAACRIAAFLSPARSDSECLDYQPGGAYYRQGRQCRT